MYFIDLLPFFQNYYHSSQNKVVIFTHAPQLVLVKLYGTNCQYPLTMPIFHLCCALLREAGKLVIGVSVILGWVEGLEGWAFSCQLEGWIGASLGEGILPDVHSSLRTPLICLGQEHQSRAPAAAPVDVLVQLNDGPVSPLWHAVIKSRPLVSLSSVGAFCSWDFLGLLLHCVQDLQAPGG